MNFLNNLLNIRSIHHDWNTLNLSFFDELKNSLIDIFIISKIISIDDKDLFVIFNTKSIHIDILLINCRYAKRKQS